LYQEAIEANYSHE
jgi:signal transduction histidine kinase